MLHITLNQSKSKADTVLAEVEARFRAWRKTVEQIFNCRIIIAKNLQHQRSSITSSTLRKMSTACCMAGSEVVLH
ncbi:hypothetical protein DPMN_049736 [Dreissena polymorpha]|uniref:Uncharacterized protein n=1 Tax=Dreissena polymorpha TaxID=45954 RepID=A0A9D4CG47_DREPO|nr:hypothetical protein DPMN_049736 [Dreissena polymorpha]